MKLKRNSWHYKINDMARDFFSPHDYRDFCSYFWATVGSTIKLMFISFVCFIAAFLATTLWQFTLILIGAIVAIVLLVAGGGVAYEVTKKSEPGFIRLSWRTFREKTCHKLEWE